MSCEQLATFLNLAIIKKRKNIIFGHQVKNWKFRSVSIIRGAINYCVDKKRWVGGQKRSMLCPCTCWMPLLFILKKNVIKSLPFGSIAIPQMQHQDQWDRMYLQNVNNKFFHQLYLKYISGMFREKWIRYFVMIVCWSPYYWICH